MIIIGTFISVGEKLPLFENSLQNGRPIQDGAIFEALEKGDGYVLSIFFNEPSQEEIEIIRNKKMIMRLIQEDDFILPLIRFGNSILIFEMSFDPTLYQNKDRVLQFLKESNLLTVVLVDSSSHIVEALRQANLPLKMIELCSYSWNKAYSNKDFEMQYKKWFQKMQRYSLERLWDKGVNVGQMGENYSLDEISLINEKIGKEK